MTAHDTPFDVLGVGFGPSNLALAIALDEISQARNLPLAIHFIEKQAAFLWHGDMLLPDSDMQISFLKDLVSLRNPTSPFTFIKYLHEKGRLEAFINQKIFFPSRIEFNDYLRWAAARFEEQVSYAEEVVAIEPETVRGVPAYLLVRSRGPSGERVRRARNLVLAVGGHPRVPAVFSGSMSDGRIFHSSAYLAAIDRLRSSDRPTTRIAIIGGGQSAAEIALDLHGRFSSVRVDMLIRGTTLKPADDTPFVNEIFNPQYTDFIFNQPASLREDILRQYRNTNYAVVDADLIRKLYGIVYQQQVTGDERLRLLSMHEVRQVNAQPAEIELSLVDAAAGTASARGYDAVVLATGYERDSGQRLLSSLDTYLIDGGVERDYRLRTKPDFQPSIYLQGYSEATHGLSDTLLSVLALRSHEIATALIEPSGRQQSAA